MAAALGRGPNGNPVEATLIIPRAWRTPPDEQRLAVRYTCRGSVESPAIEADVDGIRFALDAPVRLLPVEIPKPWGREIWFTGIEARGESQVAGRGGELGLGSYLALAPERLCRHQHIVLLKILDPRPEPVLGELYLEVHEEKREVYVVTAIDPLAWPSGRGRIRYGVNPSVRRAMGSDHACRQAFLAAVARYESVRQAIDAGSEGLEAEETAAREAARAFTDERELVPGDVISVPTWLPHSLQHGVRVVEFQTPTYERLIVSSSQRVLTQSGWDSERAIGQMRLDIPPDPPPEPIAPGVERIAAFEDFAVWRARVEVDGELALPTELPYAVIYCISGSIELGGPAGALTLSAHEAAFLPAAATGKPISAKQDSLLLVAAPGL
ncbi:MAG TPA: hypothetical protein VIS76_11725 [Pseudomonadales bacterium]